MAYFDSPKNRAMWDKELSGLREEKALRAKGISKAKEAAPEEKKAMGKVKDASKNSHRTRTSFAELMKEEAAAAKKKRVPAKNKSVEKSVTKQVNKPAKEFKGKSL